MRLVVAFALVLGALSVGIGGRWAAPADASAPTPPGGVLRTKILWHHLNKVVADGPYVWALAGDGVLAQLRASDLSVIRRISVPKGGGPMAMAGGRLWIEDYAGKAVIAIDPSSGDTVQTISIDGSRYAMVGIGSHLWLGGAHQPIIELDATDGTLLRTITMEDCINKLVTDGAHLWASSCTTPSLFEIDDSDGSVVRTIALDGPDYPIDVTADATAIWAINGSGVLQEVDPADGSITKTIKPFRRAQRIVSDGTYVWTLINGSGGWSYDLMQYRESDGRQLTSFNLPEMTVADLFADGTSVWACGVYNDKLMQIAPPPDAPVITSAVPGDSSVTLSFTEHGAAISTRTVRAYSAGQLELTSTDCTTSPCRVLGLNNGTTYTLTIAETNGIGEGQASLPTDPVTPTAPPLPPEPSTESLADGALVSWSPPYDNGTPITGYRFSTSTDLEHWSTTSVSPETTSVRIPLATASSRFVRVAAVNATGTSTYSSYLVATSTGTAPQDVTVLTQDGAPVIGGSVTWAMDPRTAWSSKAYGLLDDGSIRFPAAPAGTVVVSLVDAMLPNGLLASGDLRGVLGMGRLVLRLPVAPSVNTPTVHVQTPSGQPLAGATVSITGLSDTQSSDGMAFRMADATHSGTTGLGGDFSASGFLLPGAQATVSFDDGIITQQRVVDLGPSTTTVTMPYEPEVHATVTSVEADSGQAVIETLKVAAPANQRPGLRRASSPTLAGIAVRANLPKGTPVGSCGAVLSATTNAKGKAKLRICATTSSTVSFSATGAYVIGVLHLLVKGAAPTAVRDLRATTPSTGCLKVSWSPPAYSGGRPITGYTVTLSAPGQPTVSSSTTKSSTKVTGLANATRYRVRVLARTDRGTGPAASIVAPVA